MKEFTVLFAKELKEIFRDPRLFVATILIPIIMLPVMGFVVSHMVRESAQSVEAVEVDVLNLDKGWLAEAALNSSRFRESLRRDNITIVLLNVSSVDEAVSLLRNNETALVVIPSNFTKLVEEGVKPRLSVYFFTTKGRFGQARLHGAVTTFIDEFNKEVSFILLERNASVENPDIVRDPVNTTGTETFTYIRGHLIKASPGVIFGLLMVSSIMIPLIFLMLVTTAVQFLATSIASEKEQKTLEILLTLPVKRETILFSKLAGSAVITIIGTVGFFFGYLVYVASISSALQTTASGVGADYSETLRALGLLFSPGEFALLLVITFLSFIASLALMIPLSAMAEDVRSAQTLTSNVLMPVILPAMLLVVFTPFASPKLVVPFLFIPFTSGIAAALLLQTGERTLLYVAIAVLVVETYIAVRLAVWFYTSEKVITARLTLGRRRRGGAETR